MLNLEELTIVDSHCHLDDDRFKDEPIEEILKRASDVGVKYIQSIGTTKADFEIIQPLAEKHKNLFCSYGIHPHNVETDFVELEEILKQAKRKKVIAIGETGLDYFYDNAPRDLQIKSFKIHLEAARQLDLPVIIHSREAEEDTIEILNEALSKGPMRLLFHCFSSNTKLGDYAIEKGIYLSASGIITFKKTEGIQDCFRKVPLDQVLVETDAPYLAPVPHRGKRNEPAFTRNVLEKLSEIKGLTPSEVADATTNNFFNLFSKAVR
ncbi:MAG: TatD DNase family protein [Alphaproteobacteria bacterium]|jgi:TatD DNase family protein